MLPIAGADLATVRASRPAGWGNGTARTPAPHPAAELPERSRMRAEHRELLRQAHADAATWREIPWSVLFTDAPA